MADLRRPMADGDLEAALRELGAALATPNLPVDPAADPARRARLRIDAGARRAGRSGRWTWLAPGGRRIGRGLALALIAVAAIAAVAGANLLGLPGIRIVPAPGATATASATPNGSPAAVPTLSPTPRPSPSPIPTIASPLGSNLGLGDPVPLADLAAAVDFPIVVPPPARVGQPVTAWVLDDRMTLVWAVAPALPVTAEPGVALVLTQFRGDVDERYFEKLIGPGTTVETVAIGDVTGYWISGDPHEIVYVDERGDPVFDSRRSVADTLLWARGDVTYRLESGLGRAATIDLARTMP